MVIATDLDGTLLSDSTSVSRENLDAIKRLYESGVRTVIATGRTFFEIPEELLECKYIEYIIYSNGAAVYQRSKGVVSLNNIDRDTALGVCRILDTAETFVELYTNGIPLVDSDKFNDDGFGYYRIDPSFLPEMRRSRIAVKNLHSIISHPAFKLEMFDVFFRNMQERAECAHRIKACFPSLEITTSMSNNLEIMNSGVNKGSGLKALCRIAGINTDDVVAVGDSKNDLTLFRAAGCGLAVSNACDELKSISSGVICSNNENTMCCLEKLIGKKVLV